MLLKVRNLGVEAEKPTVILNKKDAEEIDVRPLDRIELSFRGKKKIAIVNIAHKFINAGEIGLYSEVNDQINAMPYEEVEVSPATPPESLIYIREKLAGKALGANEMRKIVEDTINRRLSDIELTAFIIALHTRGMTNEEVASLSTAMTMTGETLDLGKKEIYDKHSVGGCPGDKTSMILVPIVAAAGLTIPKTSSRAITSPAGTADRFECLAPVELSLEEIKEVVKKTNGCLVWGGSVNLAPADDLFIKIEYPLSIDPLLLPSVMSKKKAVGAKYLVVDIPTGEGAKVKTTKDAETLAEKFIELGKILNIKTVGASTYGEQPIGYAIGPALEAREALQTLKEGKGPPDLVDKVSHLAGILLGFNSPTRGDKDALRILKTRKAYQKFRQIVEAQGGNPNIKPDDLPVGEKRAVVRSNVSGKVWWINNTTVIEVARAAGTPSDKGAGILLHKKIGDSVKKNEIIFEIFAEKAYKLERALRTAERESFMGIASKFEMLLEKIPAAMEHPKYFILER